MTKGITAIEAEALGFPDHVIDELEKDEHEREMMAEEDREDRVEFMMRVFGFSKAHAERAVAKADSVGMTIEAIFG